MPKEIPAGEFKAKCLELMDEVQRTGVPVIITKRGRPVARLIPVELIPERTSLFGYMAGTIKFVGDIVNAPHESWAADSGEEDHLYESKATRATRDTAKARPRPGSKRT